MAYKTLDATTAKTLVTNFNNTYEFYEKEKDSKKKKDLKADLETKAKKIQGVLDADVADYDKNCSQRYLNIDNQLAQAMQMVKSGKTALESYAKSKKFDDLISINVLPAQFLQMEQEEKQDDQAYKAAQFAYRGNPGQFDKMEKLFGDKYIKAFRRVRQTTIDEGKKHIQPKHIKIQQLKTVADQLIQQVEVIQAGRKGGAKVQEVLTAIEDQMKLGLTDENLKTGLVWRVAQIKRSVESIRTSLNSKEFNEAMAGSMQSNLDGLLEHIKASKVIHDSWKQKIDLAVKSIPKGDEKEKTIAASIKATGEMLKKMDTMVKAMPESYKIGLADVAKARKKLGL